MERLILIILFSLSLAVTVAHAEPPVIFNGIYAKSIASGGFQHKSNRLIRDCGATNPSAGAGIAASEGSLCQYDGGTIGSLFIKNGAADTAWVDVLTASSGWSLLGNAGTGGTGILGTTDAQPFSIRTNNTNMLTFGGTNPTISSSVSQVPADGIGINQFDFRAFIDPTASTTNSSHTGMYSQLVYDNGNSGFDSTGGSYLANSANFTHNGSGDLSFASIYNGSAGFNSTGTTGQFKGIASENTIASGATVSDYYGMVTGLNTTGGIVPASNSLSLYGNFTDATIGNAFNISSNLSFSGTTVNSQGASGFNSFIQFNDSTTTTNGSNGLSAGIDINDTAALNGVNGSNVYVNVRDSATHGGLNLYSAGLNQEGSSVNPNGVNGFNANLQFSDTSDTGGVTIFNGYANTVDTAHLDFLTGLNLNPEIQGTSDVDNITMGAFSGQIRGSSTVDNITGVSINPQMSDTAAVQNFTGLQVNPQVNGTSTLANGLTGVQVTPQGTVLLNQVTGVNVDMSQVALTSGALAAGAQKAAITVNDGAFSTGYNYTVPGAAGFFQINYMGGGPIVAAGDPTSAFGFGNNLAHSVVLHDDWSLDGAGLGFVDVGFVGSLQFDAGTTMAQWTGALGGAGNPSGAGTLTTAKMFSAAGILPQGGTLAVTNMYGFEVNPNFFCLIGTNCWGFYEDSAAADNHLSKLAIGTASKKVANSDTALEIGGNKAFINGRMTTAQKNALTAVEGMQVYDTDLDQLYMYASGSWVAVGTGSGGDATDITYTPTTGSDWVNPDPVNVQEGLDDLAGRVTIAEADIVTAQTAADDAQQDIDDHLADATAAHAASAISNTPSGNLAATDVQGALNEIQTEVDGKQAAGNYITALTSDVTASGPGSVAATIAANAVSDSKFRQSAALSVVGRSANSTGNVADISASTDHNILRRSGTSIGFGSVDLSQSGAVGSSILAEANGGTGESSYTDGQLLIGNSSGNGLTKATLTQGTGITITNGNGSITIAASGGGGISASQATWDGHIGFGSTNTKVPRLRNELKDVGTSISCADSSTNGFSCTVNDDGLYGWSYCSAFTGTGSLPLATTVNGSALTTDPGAITYAQGLRGYVFVGVSSANNFNCVHFQDWLTAGDVVRPSSEGSALQDNQKNTVEHGEDAVKEIKFTEFIQWGFQALLLAIVTWGVQELSGVNKSIQELNVKMAVMIEKNENHEKRIERLEETK